MKILFRTLFIFIICLFSQIVLNNMDFNVVYPQDYFLQNDSKSIVLVSQNYKNLEMFAEEDQNQTFLNNAHLTFLNPSRNNVGKQGADAIADLFIHKLSTNKFKSKYIRAP